jgi:hypothetical protein
VSVNDPAGNGTIIRMGLFGQFALWAAAGPAIVQVNATSAAAASLKRPDARRQRVEKLSSCMLVSCSCL